MQIKKRVLSEEVKDQLTNAIFTGKYKPGERLIETQIAKDFGVSQAPVREALRELELMGIVVSEAYKGTYVKNISLKDLRDAYLVRAELEGLAIRLAVSQFSDAEIQELEDIYTQMVAAASSGDLQEVIRKDIAFHKYIVRASQNSILERAWNTISISQWTYLGVHQSRYDKSHLIKRHEPLLKAIRNRDANKAEELMRKHFLEVRESLRDE